LEGYPAAKAAFINAAVTWESLIQTPITVIIDVDFGPTRFGVPFPAGVLGSTDSQDIGSNTAYPDVRSQLIESAPSTEAASLFNLLPPARVPTDLGSTATVYAPSAVFRSLGLIASDADPDTETAQLGPPPSTGFNSAFSYDFDPSDGIDPNSLDFDAVAIHEMGHTLGFSSLVGERELDRTSPVAVSVWDLFRFRPGTTVDTFSTARRVLSSGRVQTYFFGAEELSLSTGRPDGSGGDGNQASHWKDDALTGVYVGIMDPTLALGKRETITANDLEALSSFGYQTKTGD
jgi:hypothetical protein